MTDIFCAKCVANTPHSIVPDTNGEFVATCATTDCGGVVKFPRCSTSAELASHISDYNAANSTFLANAKASLIALETANSIIAGLM